jgi:antitoxin MazE
MRLILQRIGNSQGVILPKRLLAQLRLSSNELEMTLEDEAIVLRKPGRVREGWAEASKLLHEAGEDELVWPYFENDDDASVTW